MPIILIALLVIIVLLAIVAACFSTLVWGYHIGVEEGYGHARHPNSCLYTKAGNYLKSKCSMRWPELGADFRESYHGFLRPADRPVVQDLGKYEIVYAKHQKEYIPLRTLRSESRERKVLSRWSPTAIQRRAIFAGADLFLSLLTFENSEGQPNPLQPTKIVVADELDAEDVRAELNLPSRGQSRDAQEQWKKAQENWGKAAREIKDGMKSN